MAGNGDGRVIWRRSNGTHEDVWSATYADGKAKLAERIESDDSGDAFDVQLIIDENGAGNALWRMETSSISVYVQSFASTWGGANALASVQTGPFALGPVQLTGNRAGSAVALWGLMIRGGTQIEGYEYWSGTWGSTKVQVPIDDPDHSVPSIHGLDVAMDGIGRWIAVWSQTVTGTEQVNSAWAHGGGYKADEHLQVNSMLATDATNVRVAMQSTGAAISVWFQGGAGTGIWSRYIGLTTPWSNAARVNEDAAVDGSLRIGMDDGGNALAVWLTEDSMLSTLWSARFDGTTHQWATPVKISGPMMGTYDSPALAIAPNGTALVTWARYDEDQRHIWANRYSPLKGWGTAVMVGRDTEGSAGNPDVSIAANGNGMLVWEQTRASHTSIFASTFD